MENSSLKIFNLKFTYLEVRGQANPPLNLRVYLSKIKRKKKKQWASNKARRFHTIKGEVLNAIAFESTSQEKSPTLYDSSG